MRLSEAAKAWGRMGTLDATARSVYDDLRAAGAPEPLLARARGIVSMISATLGPVAMFHDEQIRSIEDGRTK